MRFYTGRRNATNKSCLFDAKFFEFEEFSIDTFFCSSIQPQHAVICFLFSEFFNNSKKKFLKHAASTKDSKTTP